MKYRIYRKLTKIQYKDVDVDNEEEAYKRMTDAEESGWKTTDSNYITDKLVSTDLENEYGMDLFDKRDYLNNQLN